MLQSKWLLAVALLACLAASVFSQSPQLARGDAPRLHNWGPPGEPAKEAFVVSPDGTLNKVGRPPTVRLQTDVLSKPETLEQFLARHHLRDDSKNRAMLSALNPQMDFGKGTIQPGSKVEVFTIDAHATKQRFAFDAANLSRYALYSQASRAGELSEVAESLPEDAFDDPAAAKLHVQATKDLQGVALALSVKSDSLSKAEFAVAQFQLDYAYRQASATNASALKGSATRQQVLATNESVKAAKDTADRVAAGQPAIRSKTLRVNVFKGSTSVHVVPLQVYVLPSGVLGEPHLWTKAELQSFLADFSFPNDASPASHPIATDFDPRVCVGPKNAIAGMAELVAARKLVTCRKPSLGGGSTEAVLTFRAPEDIAKP